MEIKEITKENLNDLFIPCGPNESPYIESKNYIVSLWRDMRLKTGWKGFVAYEGDKVNGRVEFWPIENSLVLLSGKNLYFMPCIWVLPEFQKKGAGKALMERVLKETMDRDGIVTGAMEGEGFMPLSFFKKFAFEETGLHLYGKIKFLIKKYREGLEMPELIKPTLEHIKMDDKVVVEIIRDNACPYIRVWEEGLKRVLNSFKDKVLIKEYEVKTREDALKYGFSTVYIDGEEPFFGPIGEEEIKKTTEGYLKKKGLV